MMIGLGSGGKPDAQVVKHILAKVSQMPPTHRYPDTSRTRLETLLLYLGLGRSDGSSSVRVIKATALLAVLELRALGGADTHTAGVDLGAACTAAVCVRDTAASGELLGLAVSDVLCTSVVGSQGKGGGSNCVAKSGQYSCVQVVWD